MSDAEKEVKAGATLKPCPFCGGTAMLKHPGFANSHVVCYDNNCAEAISVEVWNRRARPEASGEPA